MSKILILLSVLICAALVSRGQNSTHQEKKGIISSIREKLNKDIPKTNTSTDSLPKKLAADTLKNPIDSLKQSKWSGNVANQKYDSIQEVLEGRDKITSTTDSITTIVNKPFDKVATLADSPQQKSGDFIQRRVDSLQQRVDKPIDKINDKASRLTKPVDQKADAVNQCIDDKTQNVQTSIQQGFNKATDGSVKAPGQNIGGVDFNVSTNQSALQGTNISNPNLPGVNTNVDGVKLPDGSLKLPDSDLNVDQLQSKADLNLPQADKIKNIKANVSQVDSKLAEAENYEQEIKGIKKLDSASIQDAAKRLEDKAADIADVSRAEEQKQALTKQQMEYMNMMQRYQDPKLLKDEIQRKSRNVVNGKINQYTPSFKEAQKKIADAKKLNSKGDKFKDLKLKRENELADKPTYERLVPGITLQVYQKEVFTIDWGAQVGYKFTNRILAGAGGVYRMGVSEKYSSWVKSLGIYGYRVYGNFNLLKGFYAHGEFESLHVSRYTNPQTLLEIGSQQAYSGYFGLGKRYDITKKIRGSAIVLYRVEFEGDLPSMSKINLRIGFDLNTKKRIRLAKADTKG
jgi:hypothetical protein